MQAIVQLSSINKKYGQKSLLKDVSFSVQRGEVTTLIGQNGAGKTTIARIILGLEQYNPGNVQIDDTISIGYVPQKFDFDNHMPVSAEQLINILSNHNGHDDEKVMEFLPEFDNVRHSVISNVSGGQLQKLLLIGVILSKPDLLILDEPTQYLDMSSQKEFYKLLDYLKREYNMSIFIISHDLFTVMKNSDQVICLNGHVCCSGKPSDKNEDFRNALSEIGVYIHQHDHTH